MSIDLSGANHGMPSSIPGEIAEITAALSRIQSSEVTLDRFPTQKEESEASCTPLPQTTIDALVSGTFTNNVLPFLGLNDRERIAKTSRAFRICCQEAQCQRLHELFSSNAPKDLFTPFGIDCPRGRLSLAESSRALASIKRRVEPLIWWLPENLRSDSAENFVVRLHPERLYTLLQEAYDQSLWGTFSESSGVVVGLFAKNVQNIREWLERGPVTMIETHLVYNKQLACLPSEIGRLTGLRELHLVGNRLTLLSAQIGQLTNLQTLFLFGNQFTSLPAEIGQLTNLEWLRLDDNHLSSLPAEIGRLRNLKKLDMTNNRLTSFPVAICQLVGLRELYLSDNQLSTFPAEIGQLINLQELYLSRTPIASLPAELQRLAPLRCRIALNEGRSIRLPEEIDRLMGLGS